MTNKKETEHELTGDLEATEEEAESVKGGHAKGLKHAKHAKTLGHR